MGGWVGVSFPDHPAGQWCREYSMASRVSSAWPELPVRRQKSFPPTWWNVSAIKRVADFPKLIDQLRGEPVLEGIEAVGLEGVDGFEAVLAHGDFLARRFLVTVSGHQEPVAARRRLATGAQDSILPHTVTEAQSGARYVARQDALRPLRNLQLRARPCHGRWQGARCAAWCTSNCIFSQRRPTPFGVPWKHSGWNGLKKTENNPSQPGRLGVCYLKWDSEL